MNLSVKISNISKKFNATIALNSINCEINKGEIFGFIGPDGAGKTTLFRILTSLIIPDTGTAIVDGDNVVSDYKLLRNKLGYMPGRFSLYQDLTVEENLKFFAGVFKTSIKENYHLIEPIYKQIEPFKNRRAGKLSGGMKQKLALSCALIHKPNVLFLDEPTTGVDAVSRKEFWEMLKHLKSNGLTIVVSTPYMDEAAQCDRVALIQKGEILDINTPQNIVNSFSHKLFALKCDNMYELNIESQTNKNTHSAYLFGETIHWVAKSEECKMNFISEINAKNFKNFEILQIQPSIEDCFMELMTK